jgi:DNA-binding NtrC family response regulator
MLAYNYPGNFRELENILERAIALAGDDKVDVADLQLTLASRCMNRMTAWAMPVANRCRFPGSGGA